MSLVPKQIVSWIREVSWETLSGPFVSVDESRSDNFSIDSKFSAGPRVFGHELPSGFESRRTQGHASVSMWVRGSVPVVISMTKS